MINFEMVRAEFFDNWRAYARTALLVMIAGCAAAAALLLTGCGAPLELEPVDDAGELEQPDELEPVDVDAGELEQPDELKQPAGELEPEPEACEPLEPDPIFALPAHRCAGHWADNSDSSTRFTAHPDTGLCTFACVWEEPKCDEAWYGDPRCFPAHAAVLGQLCAELGGTCELNAERTNRYCVAGQ